MCEKCLVLLIADGCDRLLVWLSRFRAVSVGFEYESCMSVVLWEKRSSSLQGYELEASSMGGWTLDKHHVLDLQNGERIAYYLLKGRARAGLGSAS